MNYNEVGVYSKVGRNIESDELWVSQLQGNKIIVENDLKSE